MYIQITIDGPSGVGKSTLAKALSKELGYVNINSGLIFRGLSWYFIKNNIPTESISDTLTEIAKHKFFFFQNNTWFLNGVVIPENEMINQEISKKASEISIYPEVRNYVLAIERGAAESCNIVMEGRDIGSSVFPDAFIKIFLTASIQVRSHRRYQELKNKGLLGSKTHQDIAQEIQDRDDADANRKLSPLIRPKDCYVLNSDEKNTEELVKIIKSLLNKKIFESKVIISR